MVPPRKGKRLQSARCLQAHPAKQKVQFPGEEQGSDRLVRRARSRCSYQRYEQLQLTDVQSWCQVAAETMPTNSIIVGVDLVPIKPIPRCITFQGDITIDKCRAGIRQHLKTWKADTVLHDGAPNVGTAWVQDAFSQAELALQSLRLATDFLIHGGTFVTKVFRSNDYNSFLWVCKQLFDRVEATKPPSSRNVSAEIFVVCRGYKAPKRIDPRLLDPRAVFAELAGPSIDHEAKVFKPETKKRKREGYEEGDWTQYKEAPASEFIQTTDPIHMLATLNKLSFVQEPNGDIALATLDRLPETTEEIRHACADLKVLGRKDFKNLLKWRLKVRQIFGFSQKGKKVEPLEKEEEVATVEPMDEDLRIQEELQQLRDQQDATKKKERRKENEKKRKEIVRMQMHMIAPTDIGLEQHGPLGEDAIFALRSLSKAKDASAFQSGKMRSAVEQPKEEDEESFTDFGDSDDDGDTLEASLDAMYSHYQERKANADAKHLAKRRREGAEEWDGFDDDGNDENDTELVEDSASDVSSSDAEEGKVSALFGEADEDEKQENSLSRRANIFFDNEIFDEITIPILDKEKEAKDDANDSGIELNDANDSSEVITASKKIPIRERKSQSPPAKPLRGSKGKDGLEYVKPEPLEHSSDEDENKQKQQSARPNIDIITAEAMTLAHSLVTGKKTKEDVIDDGFNKYAFRDTDGLPEWFLDDEQKHSKALRPITAAAAAAIKEKERALNARPIKKVREAKDRKRFRAARRLEKLKKKSAVLAEEEGPSEKDKAQSIAKLMNKAAKKQPKKKVRVVVAKGPNRGISGRPRGMKGKYKMVDSRMKKDVRAMKRVAAKK